MQRLIKIILLISLLVPFNSQAAGESHTSDLAKEQSPLVQNRLVVFESFMRST